ncbi:hypothetical protein BXZ70DRAFT_1074760 [Cristinia sonorae]|uniref:RRM domain-containing protein n=1 Tax=Cristinia sonorae TaxID=1940300 RepID=A0A8K0UYK1_9AGAR|nr:hypothetical protein BXZ70DRAFT_1074760 [Cristinia sonorae]
MSKSVTKILGGVWRRYDSYTSAQLGDTTHLKVTGLSRTATPNDLRRLCVKSGLENIAAVSINYNRFLPTREGFISFTHPNFLRNAIKVLSHATVGGYTINVEPSPPPEEAWRLRGYRGRTEAAERGVLGGNGPGAGLGRAGRNVLITGLPHWVTPQSLQQHLSEYELASKTDTEEQVIVKVEAEKSNLPAYIVRLANVSAAHRLVRQLHMTPYTKDPKHTKWQVKARVIV